MHADRGRQRLARVFTRLAGEMGVSGTARVAAAVQAGFRALDAFNEWQQRRGQEVLANLKPGEKAVVLVGRSYNTCDPELTLNLPEKLRELGILALPMDFLPLEAAVDGVSRDNRNMYWKSGQKILCAGRFIASHPGLFALYVTNFGCGPDSFLLKYFGRELENKPFLTLEIDEHSADAGISTRCEAFVDTIRGAGPARDDDASPDRPARGGIVPVRANDRCINLPYMIDHGYLWVAAAKYYGNVIRALPMSDDHALELGRKYTTGKECFPAIVTAGDILKRTLAADFEPDKEAFLIPSASGPCRFGQYNQLYRMALDEIGLKEVPVITLDQTGGWDRHLANLGRGYRLRTWRATVLLDLLQKMLLERRPYEINAGEMDGLYREMLERLTRQVERDRDGFDGFARQARTAFEAVRVERSFPKPRIGLIGEIFVRSNQFANDNVIRRLEALGAQCTMPPVQEWFNYTEHQRLRRSRLRLEGNLGDWLRQRLSALVQARTAAAIRRRFDGAITDFAREMPTPEVLKRGRAYLSPAVEGEAILSLGRAVEYAEHGFDGIVNVIPFGCMPGTVVSMLLHQFNHDFGLPVFNLVVDGTRHAGQDIRLEAFYHQCREHMRQSAR